MRDGPMQFSHDTRLTHRLRAQKLMCARAMLDNNNMVFSL